MVAYLKTVDCDRFIKVTGFSIVALWCSHLCGGTMEVVFFSFNLILKKLVL